MRKVFFLYFYLMLFVAVASNDTLPISKPVTRQLDIKQFVSPSLYGPAPMLSVFNAVGVRKTVLAYSMVNKEAAIHIVNTQPLPGFFKRIGIYASCFFNNASRNTFMAVALTFPFFLLLCIGILSPILVNTFIIKPRITNPERPDNDDFSDE